MKEGIFIKIWLNKEVYKSPQISSYGLAAYCAIKSIPYLEETKEAYINMVLLAYQLTQNIHCPRKFVEKIKIGFDELVEHKVVSIVNERARHIIIDVSKLHVNTSDTSFTVVEYDEILKIFQIDCYNTFSLLRYFTFLMGTISSSIEVWLNQYQHKSNVVGNLTISSLSKLSGISTRSIIEYNKILEDSGLLYVCRPNDVILNQDSGAIRRMVNVYGRPADKVYIDHFSLKQKQYENSYGYFVKGSEASNMKRRLAQIYIQLSKGNDKSYSKQDIVDVYAYVLAENQKYRKLYSENHYDEYLKKIRDDSVFEKYDFLKEIPISTEN